MRCAPRDRCYHFSIVPVLILLYIEGILGVIIYLRFAMSAIVSTML